MSTLLLTRNEAAQLSGATSSAVNKAIEQRVVATRSVRNTRLIDARDVGALGLFAELHFALPVKEKQRLARWLRTAEPGEEMSLGGSVSILVRKTEDLDQATQAALRYLALKDRFLEVNPDRQGGEPVIRGTRVPIRGLAKQIEAGETIEVLREEYPYIDEDAFDFAVLWSKANPRRGRPGRVERTTAEPASRAAYLERRKRKLPTPA